MDDFMSKEDCNKEISDEDLNVISTSCCKEFRKLSSHLGMTEINLHDIERNENSEEGKRCAFFKKWKNVKGSGATYKALITALLKYNCKQDAEKVFKIQLKTAEDQASAVDFPSSTTLSGSSKTPALSADVKSDLKFLLEKYQQQLVARYASYVHCIRMAILQSPTSPIELRSYLLSLNAFQSGHNVQCKLLSEVRAKLEEADTIHKLCDIVTVDCSSFLDIGIFECIVKEYHIDQGQDELKYSEHLKDYIEKHTISEFAKVIPNFVKPTVCSKELTLKFNKAATSKLTNIIDLRETVAGILHLLPSALQLIDITEGCVVVTFSLPALVAEIVFTRGKKFTLEEEEKFRSSAVLWLECDGYKFYFKKDSHDTEVTIPEANKEDLQFRKSVKRESDSIIRLSFFNLLEKIAASLAGVVEDMSVFRQCILHMFGTGDIIPKTANVHEIFTLLTEKKYWNFEDVSNLSKIVEQFGGELEAKLVNEYKEELNEYKIAPKHAKLIEKKEENVSANLKEKYDSQYLTKLSVELNRPSQYPSRNILLKIEKLWNSLCREFNMPSLPQLLDGFVEGNIIIIHWIIQHPLTWKILERIGDGIEFFQRESIAVVCLEGVCVYDQKMGINHEKIRYVKLLVTIQEGSDIDKVHKTVQDCFPDINIDEALLVAAHHGHEVLMTHLLDHGADMYHRDRNGDSILSLSKRHPNIHEWLQNECEAKTIEAAQKRDLPMLKRSLDIGVDVNIREKDEEYGWTVLMWLCDNSDTEMVDYLLQRGAHVDAKDYKEWTSLILSSRRGNLEIVKKLLDRSDNVNQLTIDSWSALMWTAQEGHADVARLLLDRGANAMSKDKNGFTPLLQASQDGHLSVVKVLVECNPDMDMDQHSNKEWTPPMVATKNGHLDVVQYLAAHNSNVHYQRKLDGVTALHIASFKGYNNIVRYLCLKDREKVNLQDTDGLTSMMFSAKKGHLDVVRTLVENGHANGDLQENANGWTAIFFAVEGNHQEVLDYLLRSRRIKNISHKDNRGHTIVDIVKLINPGVLDCFMEHYRDETEAMIRSTPAKPVFNDYRPMLENITNRYSLLQQNVHEDPRANRMNTVTVAS